MLCVQGPAEVIQCFSYLRHVQLMLGSSSIWQAILMGHHPWVSLSRSTTHAASFQAAVSPKQH